MSHHGPSLLFLGLHVLYFHFHNLLITTVFPLNNPTLAVLPEISCMPVLANRKGSVTPRAPFLFCNRNLIQVYLRILSIKCSSLSSSLHLSSSS